MVTMVRLASKSLWLSESVSRGFHVELYLATVCQNYACGVRFPFASIGAEGGSGRFWFCASILRPVGLHTAYCMDEMRVVAVV